MNLLVALHSLLEERSVTAAAKRVSRSQPAMSHALGRLRALFDDPLLVRSSGGMVPTPRAEALIEPLRQVLRETEQLLEPPRFDPAKAKGALRIATTDYVSVLILPLVLERLLRDAPGLKLDVIPWQGPGTWKALERGELDLAIHIVDDAPAGFYRQQLFTDDFACVMRKEHPMIGKKPTLKRYLGVKHGLITVTGVGEGHVNACLEREGLMRDIVLRIPSFLAAPLIVAKSDLVLTLPRRLAELFSQLAGLILSDPPLKLGKMVISQVWHERTRHDPAHVWVRKLIAEEVCRLDE